MSDEPAANAINCTTYNETNNISDKWCTGCGYGNNSWLKVDLGQTYQINRWKVVHEKGSGSSYTNMYTQNFRLQVSDNGIDNWRDIDVVNNNILGVTDRNVTTFSARYVRLLVDTADYDGAARIYEFQLYKD